MLVIKYVRLKKGLSQARLARLVNTYQPNICHIEQGRLRPDDGLLGRLADVLGVFPPFTLLRPVVIHEHAIVPGSDERVLA